MLRPAAVSLRLGTEAYVLSSHQPVDIAQENTFPRLVARPVDEHGRIVIRPGEVLLARTQERVGFFPTGWPESSTEPRTTPGWESAWCSRIR